MNTFIYRSNNLPIDKTPYEVVETKGKGHPDNISDTLAEKISATYSKFCLDNFGIVPRHMVDKITILGGGSNVAFGHGEMKSPIRVLLNGRFTSSIEGSRIDYLVITQKCIKEYMTELFPLLDTEKYLKIIDNTHSNEGPGVVYDSSGTTRSDRSNFFHVDNEIDRKKHSNQLRTNDTSTTVSYFPLSCLEKMVLDIESQLNSNAYKEQNPHVGSDIKVMGIRRESLIELTVCVPLIANYITSREHYKERLIEVEDFIRSISNKYFSNKKTSIFVNTRDNYDTDDFYLTAIGSAIESGDEGAVGRGNRSRGVIPFSRHFSMEAPAGKNPIYHTGKLFTAIGDIISERIYSEVGYENNVFMTSKMGGDILEPWSVAVELVDSRQDFDQSSIESIVSSEITNHYETSLKIISRQRKVNNY